MIMEDTRSRRGVDTVVAGVASALDDLDSSVGDLGKRLEPVLHDAPPDCPGAESEQGGSCGLGHTIFALQRRVESAVTCVQAMIGRLEI